MNAKVLNVILGILLIIVIGLFINTSTDKNLVIDDLNSELSTYRNKDGEQVARINYLEQENTRAFLKIDSKDTLITELQKLVEKYKRDLKKGGTASIIKTVTKIDTITQEVVVMGDSIFPTYLGGVELGEWVSAQIRANKDTISLSLDIRNDYSIVFGREPQGFLGLGRARPFAEVTNHNPYTETESIKTYAVAPSKQRKWGMGPIIGYGLSADDNSSFVWFAGVGLSYQLIKF